VKDLIGSLDVMKCLYLIGVLIFTMAVIAWPNSSAAMSVDTELFLIDESVLKGRVLPAIADFLDHGDSAAAKRLVHEAISSQQFQAALKSNVSGDRMTAQYLAKSSKELVDGRLPKEILDDTGEIIRDQDAIRRRQTTTILSPFLVIFFCSWSPDRLQTHVSLSHSRLTNYLRSKSPWMDEMLGSSNELLWNAPDLPLPMGGEGKFLTLEGANTLLSRLREVPSPSDDQELIKQYETLRKFLEIAAHEPRFRLLIRTT
jgi:hypothetical protein